MKCPITGVNLIPFTLCVIAGFIFLFGFEFFWHSTLLMDTYLETPELWRPEHAMQDFFIWNIIRIIILVKIIALIYTKNHEGKGLAEGLRFGALVGLLLGTMMASSYIWMPISAHLAMMWFAGGFIMGIGLGVINALIYKHPQPKTA